MRRPGDRAGRQVFVFLGGQHENIGDVVLRRQLVAGLDGIGPIHAFVGAAPDDYVQGLELPPGSRAHRSLAAWVLRATAAAALPRRSALVLNAGEISSSAHDGLWHLALLPALLVGRLTDNPGIRIGVGARDRTPPWSLPLRAAGRLCRMVVWRDQVSRDMYGYGQVGPDWAFRERHPVDPGPRPLVAISWRGDRPRPDHHMVQTLGAWVRERGYEPVVVTQVERDEPANARLASSLACAHVGAGRSDLAAREAAVRQAYGAAAIVISDRIHALIVGAACGAQPVSVLGYADVKVGRTMSAAGLELPVLVTPPGTPCDDLHAWLDARVAERDVVMKQLESAADAVDSYEHRMRGVLR